LQDKLADDLISSGDFVDMKSRYEGAINNSKLQISELKLNKGEFTKYLEFAIPFLENLGTHYRDADIDTKQKIIGSIYTDFMIYDGKRVRTPKINEAVRLIALNNKGLEAKKKGMSTIVGKHSGFVIVEGVLRFRFTQAQ